MKCKHFDVGDPIYHKFSHSTASYTFNEENVNVMLEFYFIQISSFMNNYYMNIIKFAEFNDQHVWTFKILFSVHVVSF